MVDGIFKITMVKLIGFFMLVTVASHAEVFQETISGSSINPQVCGLVFIRACQAAVHQCQAVEMDEKVDLPCNSGCSIFEQEYEPSIQPYYKCRVTAQLIANRSEYIKVGIRARLGYLTFDSEKKCSGFVEWIRGSVSEYVWPAYRRFSIQATCDGKVAEVRVTPLSEQVLEEDDFYMKYINLPEGDCLYYSGLLGQVLSDEFILKPRLVCDKSGHKAFRKDYSFEIEAIFK